MDWSCWDTACCFRSRTCLKPSRQRRLSVIWELNPYWFKTSELVEIIKSENWLHSLKISFKNVTNELFSSGGNTIIQSFSRRFAAIDGIAIWLTFYAAALMQTALAQAGCHTVLRQSRAVIQWLDAGQEKLVSLGRVGASRSLLSGQLWLLGTFHTTFRKSLETRLLQEDSDIDDGCYLGSWVLFFSKWPMTCDPHAHINYLLTIICWLLFLFMHCLSPLYWCLGLLTLMSPYESSKPHRPLLRPPLLYSHLGLQTTVFPICPRHMLPAFD